MTDLPIVSLSPAVAARPSASASLRAARNAALPLHTGPFQDALALELERELDGPFLPGLGVSAAPVERSGSFKQGKDTAEAAVAADAPPVPVLPGLGVSAAAAGAGSSLKQGKDTAETAIAADAPPGFASIGIPPAPPGLALLAPSAIPAAALSSSPLATKETARAGFAPYPHNDPLAKTSAATTAESQPPIVDAAADSAAHGKFPLPAEGGIRNGVAFDPSLLEHDRSAPAAAMQTANVATAPAQVAHAPAAALETRVGARGWDQGLGDRLLWMAGQKQQVAELHLNPPDLGPLKITLTLNHDQASAQFVSAHATVREAVETAMPRLREMLADSGITLGNASVSTGAFREQAQHEPRTHPAAFAAAATDPGAVTRGERLLRRAHGLVDTFA